MQKQSLFCDFDSFGKYTLASPCNSSIQLTGKESWNLKLCFMKGSLIDWRKAYIKHFYYSAQMIQFQTVFQHRLQKNDNSCQIPGKSSFTERSCWLLGVFQTWQQVVFDEWTIGRKLDKTLLQVHVNMNIRGGEESSQEILLKKILIHSVSFPAALCEYEHRQNRKKLSKNCFGENNLTNSVRNPLVHVTAKIRSTKKIPSKFYLLTKNSHIQCNEIYTLDFNLQLYCFIYHWCFFFN